MTPSSLQVLGAAIVFLSWIVTNTISSRLADAKEAVARATTDDTLHQRLERLRRNQREIKAVVDRLDHIVSEINPGSIFSSFPAGSSRELRNVSMLNQSLADSLFEHESLQELISLVRRLAWTEGLPAATRVELEKCLQDADKALDQYRTVVTRWESQRREAENTLTDDSGLETGLDQLQQAQAEFLARGGLIQQRSIKQRDELHRVHADVLRHVIQRQNSLLRAHVVSQRLSWFLYAAGTSLVLLGGWLETR